jgi:hypothetical protein
MGIQHPEELPDEIWTIKLKMLERIRREEQENNPNPFM